MIININTINANKNSDISTVSAIVSDRAGHFYAFAASSFSNYNIFKPRYILLH